MIVEKVLNVLQHQYVPDDVILQSDEETEDEMIDVESELTLAAIHFFETVLNEPVLVEKCKVSNLSMNSFSFFDNSNSKCFQHFTSTVQSLVLPLAQGDHD